MSSSRSHFLTVVFGALTLFAAPFRTTAQTSIVTRDAGARMLRLAPGIYAILHDDAIQDWPSGATDWPHSNVGMIVGETDVLVVDSDYLPSRAAADIELIRSVTRKRVRYLVNTHWHGDHMETRPTSRPFPESRSLARARIDT